MTWSRTYTTLHTPPPSIPPRSPTINSGSKVIHLMGMVGGVRSRLFGEAAAALCESAERYPHSQHILPAGALPVQLRVTRELIQAVHSLLHTTSAATLLDTCYLHGTYSLLLTPESPDSDIYMPHYSLRTYALHATYYVLLTVHSLALILEYTYPLALLLTAQHLLLTGAPY